MKSRILIGLALTAVVMIFTAAMFIKRNPRQEFLKSRAELVVRQIGHRLLLHAGDSTSRVLPVKQVREGVFQLEFEHDFSFKPDSLVTIVQRSLASSDLPLDYMVNVFKCATKDMVYGFEIRPQGGEDIIACLGRVQPKGCYNVQVSFLDTEEKTNDVYYLSVIGVLGLVIFAFVGKSVSRPVVITPSNVQTNKEATAIGKFQFDNKARVLKIENEVIQLTNKESHVLAILSASMNELVDRDVLIKEVWENEGVITGRSLDMFISKLRKKLSADVSVGIVNVHGRGYRLEVSR